MNNQGSLFRLTTAEYETIRSIIDEENEESSELTKTAPSYTIQECSTATGYSLDKITGWKSALERKKQAVFFGPPGTGKTYIANHLARNLVADTDGFIELVQFHPAYAYEDFIQGIRPETGDGGSLTFDRVPGRFLAFCVRARQRSGPCVLIIDEINRANLSRVFGELMYLLEYRNIEISLAGGERFSIPPIFA